MTAPDGEKMGGRRSAQRAPRARIYMRYMRVEQLQHARGCGLSRCDRSRIPVLEHKNSRDAAVSPPRTSVHMQYNAVPALPPSARDIRVPVSASRALRESF